MEQNGFELRLEIERARKGLLDRYVVVKAAMQGVFLNSLVSLQRPSVTAQKELNARLQEIGFSAKATEKDAAAYASGIIIDLVDSAISKEDMVKRIQVFQGQVLEQISRDAAAVSEFFRKTQLRLQSRVVSTMATQVQAIEGINRPELFYYKDKAGKLWRSDRYLETASNVYYYDLANDLIVGKLLSAGKFTGFIDRPGHASHGIRFDLVDYGVIHNQFFHPGSTGIVV